MFEILETLAERHVTPTRVMIRVSARCCTCGTTKIMTKQRVNRLNREGAQFCPKCPDNPQHHMADTRPYRIWRGMIARIQIPETKGYEHYGGRGITVDPAWLRFKNFWRDMQPGYSDAMTIERKDVNGPYCKDNCRWATNMEQQANKRTTRLVSYRGREMHLAEFCRTAGVTRGAISSYLQKHGTGDAAMAAYSKSTYPRWRASRARKKSTTS